MEGADQNNAKKILKELYLEKFEAIVRKDFVEANGIKRKIMEIWNINQKETLLPTDNIYRFLCGHPTLPANSQSNSIDRSSSYEPYLGNTTTSGNALTHRFKVGDYVSFRIEHNNVSETVVGFIAQYGLDDQPKYEVTTLDLDQENFTRIEYHLQEWHALNEEEHIYWIVKEGQSFGISVHEENLKLTCVRLYIISN